MASDSHRHGDKWIKHNLTVIDKDGAHPDGGWKSRTSRPGASDTRLRTFARLGVQCERFRIKFNSQTQQLAPEFRHRRIDCPVAKMIHPATKLIWSCHGMLSGSGRIRSGEAPIDRIPVA